MWLGPQCLIKSNIIFINLRNVNYIVRTVFTNQFIKSPKNNELNKKLSEVMFIRSEF